MEVFGMSLDVLWRSLGGLGMSFGCVSDVLGCSSEVFGRFITVLGESTRGLLVWILHRFGVRSEGPVDPKNSMVFIRRDTILGVIILVPFSTYCSWKDFGVLLEVFRRSLEVLWRSLRGLGRSFGGLWVVWERSLENFWCFTGGI